MMNFEDAIVYLLSKEAVEYGEYRLPWYNLHDLIYVVEDDFEDLGVELNFNDATGSVHARQIEEAVEEIVPRRITMDGSQFHLVDEAAWVSYEKTKDELSEEAIEALDEIFVSPEFRGEMDQVVRR